MNRDSLRALLIKHESLKTKPYKDTEGKLTVGVGRNLDDVGITEAEAMVLLENDLARIVSACRMNFTWFDSLDDSRQNVIASMAFNMGITGLMEFKKMLAAITARDFAAAANEMLCSKWSGQVGARAAELAQMMRDGDTVH